MVESFCLILHAFLRSHSYLSVSLCVCVCIVHTDMLTGWWRVSDIEELRALVSCLHSRGIREKGLQRHMQKYMEIIPQVCTKHKDGE